MTDQNTLGARYVSELTFLIGTNYIGTSVERRHSLTRFQNTLTWGIMTEGKEQPNEIMRTSRTF